MTPFRSVFWLDPLCGYLEVHPIVFDEAGSHVSVPKIAALIYNQSMDVV